MAEALRRGLNLLEPDAAEVLPGQGVYCKIGDREIRAGNAAFLKSAGVSGTEGVWSADSAGSTAVLIAEGDSLAGSILLRDRLREGVPEALTALRELGLSDQRLVTGDRQQAAEIIAREAGIHEVHAELLPAGKMNLVRALTASGRHPVMIGEGLNDAPALASADVGIAVSGASDITTEAANVVYLPNSLEALPLFFSVSRKADATAWQNIILFAGVLNAAAVLLAAAGALGPAGAAVTHQLSSFFVMMNSLRLLRLPGGRKLHWQQTLSRLAERSGLPNIEAQIKLLAPHLEFSALASAFVDRWPRLRGPVIISAVLYLAAGLYAIRPDETGIVERFGRRILPYDSPGLHYKLPWPVDRLTRLQTGSIGSKMLFVWNRRTMRARGAGSIICGCRPKLPSWSARLSMW